MLIPERQNFQKHYAVASKPKESAIVPYEERQKPLSELLKIVVLGGKIAAQYVRNGHESDAFKTLVYGVIGVTALLVALETPRGKHQLQIFWGGCASAVLIYAARMADKWEESTRLDRALKDVEKEDIADQIAAENEARQIIRRAELGLPDPSAEITMLRQQVIEAMASDSSQGTAIAGSDQQATGNGKPEEIFKEEDIAETIGNSPDDENNFLFVGKSRSGKTSVILNAMAQKSLAVENPYFVIFNGKPERSTIWSGLKDTNAYLPVNSRLRAQLMVARFMDCLKQLQHWQDSDCEDHRPLIVVADEINNQRALLSKVETTRYDSTSSVFCTQCMSEQSGWWISTHSHNVEMIGLDRKLQTSFQIVCLGRNGKYETIEAAIDDRFLIRSSAKRKELRAQLDAYIQAGGDGALAFNNLGGVNRIVRLPFYQKDVTIRATGELPQKLCNTQHYTERLSDAPLCGESSDMRDRLNGMLRDALDEHMRRINRNSENKATDSVSNSSETESGVKPNSVSEENHKPHKPRARPYNPSLLDEQKVEFLTYLLEKNQKIFNTRSLFQNWGKRRFPSGMNDFKKFLAELIGAGAITANDSELNDFSLLITSISL